MTRAKVVRNAPIQIQCAVVARYCRLRKFAKSFGLLLNPEGCVVSQRQTNVKKIAGFVIPSPGMWELNEYFHFRSCLLCMRTVWNNTFDGVASPELILEFSSLTVPKCGRCI